MEMALKALEKRVAAGKLKDRNKTERRLGSLQVSNPRVADLYEIKAVDNRAMVFGDGDPQAPRLGLRRRDEEALACRDGAGRAVDEFALADDLGWTDGRSYLTTRITAPDGYIH